MRHAPSPNPTLPPLFPHQHEALDATLLALTEADRCKVIMACATGKTRVGLEVALGQQARTVIVYFPSLALMRQTLPLWIQALHRFKGGAAFLCVCSDSTVTVAQDEALVTTEELRAELHLDNKSVTTDSQAVTEFLTVASRHAAVRVVFSTYQSSSVVRDGCPTGFAFDLGLYDEAHRTAGKESLFSASLHDCHTAIRKRVFLTATPKHLDYRSRNKKDGERTVLFSMDNETLYGRTAYSLQIRQAIQSDIIANYKVLVSIVDDEMLATSFCHDNPRRLNKESVAHALAIRKSMQQYSIRKVVTFHDSVADARKFATDPNIRNELAAETFHVNGSIASATRTTIMQQFAESPTAVVTNARCLTEGVDVPEIDMVAFLHPKKSKVDIVQAIGRASANDKALARPAISCCQSMLPTWKRAASTAHWNATDTMPSFRSFRH